MSGAGADLLQLVQIEHDLDEQLTAARAEAARLIEATRQAAQAREQDLEQDIRAAGQQLKDQAGRELAARLAAIAADADAGSRAFRSVDDCRVGELAAALVRRLAGGAAA
jgi:F0F1-type ATP synthase membrane subunit b/b'